MLLDDGQVALDRFSCPRAERRSPQLPFVILTVRLTDGHWWRAVADRRATDPPAPASTGAWPSEIADPLAAALKDSHQALSDVHLHAKLLLRGELLAAGGGITFLCAAQRFGSQRQAPASPGIECRCEVTLNHHHCHCAP